VKARLLLTYGPRGADDRYAWWGLEGTSRKGERSGEGERELLGWTSLETNEEKGFKRLKVVISPSARTLVF